jgi:hypothetical protein
MSQAGANRWVAWILALAALAWLAVAAWTLTAQQERSALGLLGSEAPRDTLLLLLPLAVGWGLVL